VGSIPTLSPPNNPPARVLNWKLTAALWSVKMTSATS
jgi:hypothetical protein